MIQHSISKSLILATLLASSHAFGATRTLTGADLLTEPGVTFPTPTSQPIPVGTSIQFGPGAREFEKLFVLPLIPSGTRAPGSVTTLQISVNLTRLACSSSPVCSDHDPHILLGDGTNLVGAVIADNNAGEALATQLRDAGNFGTARGLTSVFTGAGYPGIGQSVDVDIVFTLEDNSTTVEVSFLSGSATFNTLALDPNADTSLVFMRDNDIGEQYRVNTVTIPELEVPVAFDIKPQSCSNPLNVKSRGKLPVAILGTGDLDATTIDIASLRLEDVPPIRSALEDVGTPFEPFLGKEAALDCNDYGPDGLTDLTLKFERQEIIAALGDVEDGEVRVLTLSGNLLEEFGGTPLKGEDVVVILKKGHKSRR